jgi:hypothetical protein
MSAILYPVAATAEAALNAPRGRAARERDAERLAGEAVSFTRELTGPVFKTEEAARAAYAGRLDDDRPGSRAQVAPEDRYCDLKPVAERGRIPFTGKHTVWRLSVAYWRIGSAYLERPELEQARKVRRGGKTDDLDASDLAAMTHQPLRPMFPQKALDIGLFEVRLPENPAIIMPDE